MIFMSRFKTLNAIVGIIMVLGLSLGTMSAASAQSSAKLPFKGQHLTIWDFFPSTPSNTPERAATLKVASKWASMNKATVTELQPTGGTNATFIANPQNGPDVLMAPNDEVAQWVGSHLVVTTKLNKKLYVKVADQACTI